MKNLNMVREYKGYYFWFDSDITMYRFIKLYKDMWKDYEFIEFNNDVCLKVICGKGVIPTIRNGLKKNMETRKHGRYFIKAS